MKNDTYNDIMGSMVISSLWFALIGVIALVYTFVGDVYTYQSIMESNYETPWYSQNWLQEPYINFRLSQYPSTFRVTTNGDNSQLWIVKEKKVGDKKFWTVDYKLWMTNRSDL